MDVSTSGGCVDYERTVCGLRCVREVMVDVEAPGLGVLSIVVGTVRDYDLLIWNTRIAQVLRLGGTLVSEPGTRTA